MGGALGLLAFHIGIRRVSLSYWQMAILAICFASLIGRLHTWERDGYRPMAEYAAMVFQSDLERFARYRFDWVVMPRYSNFEKSFGPPTSPSSGPAAATTWELCLCRQHCGLPRAQTIGTARDFRLGKPTGVTADIAGRFAGDPNQP